MKTVVFHPDVDKKLRLLHKKDIKRFKKINKQIKLLQTNPRHPSLRLHKITRNVENVWSISIDMSFRMLYIEKDRELYFFAMGTHDEVYQK